MTTSHELKEETIKKLYNAAYRWYIWGVKNDYIETMFREALDYVSVDALDRWRFDIALESFQFILSGFWNEDEQFFTVNIDKFNSVCNYYNIMTKSVNRIIYDKDFMLHFYCKHQDIARAMLSYKEITND